METYKPTLDRLKVLIEQGNFEDIENDIVEFKPVPSSKGDWNQRYKSVCAFLNTGGGWLILGVKEEKDPRKYVLTGWQQHGEEKVRLLKEQFRDFEGKPIEDIDRQFPPPFTEDVQGIQLLVVPVIGLPEHKKFAFFERQAYQRIISGDERISNTRLIEQERWRADAARSPEIRPIEGSSIDVLELDRINRYIMALKLSGSGETLKATLADARGFLIEERFLAGDRASMLGILVCAQRPVQWLGFRAQLTCLVEEEGEVARDKKTILGCIVDLSEQGFGFLQQRTRAGISAAGGGRRIPEYPDILLRESLNNALVHRDYTNNMHVLVEVVPEVEVRITNPGRLRPEQSIRTDRPRVRAIIPDRRAANSRLAEVLERFDLYEGAGRGMAALVQAALKNEIDVPYYHLLPSDVRLVLPKGRVLDEHMMRRFASFDRFILERTSGRQLSGEQQTVLAYLVKSEWLNDRECFTILLTERNNHYAAISDLERFELVQRTTVEDRTVLRVAQELVRRDYIPVLRDIFGALSFDPMSNQEKNVLGIIFQHNEYSMTPLVSARKVAIELWQQQPVRSQDLTQFEKFSRTIRKLFTRLATGEFVVEEARRAFRLNRERRPQMPPMDSSPPPKAPVNEKHVRVTVEQMQPALPFPPRKGRS